MSSLHAAEIPATPPDKSATPRSDPFLLPTADEPKLERLSFPMEATMAELGIDDNEPRLTDEEKRATVHDLLKARSGVYHPALYETARMKEKRPPRHSHASGTFWYYNNWDFNVLGTIAPIARRGSQGEGAIRFGLGWAIEPAASDPRIRHSGSNGTGFRSYVEFDPAKQDGLIIMTNADSGDDLWRDLVQAVGRP